jgi:hypothetical protein
VTPIFPATPAPPVAPKKTALFDFAWVVEFQSLDMGWIPVTDPSDQRQAEDLACARESITPALACRYRVVEITMSCPVSDDGSPSPRLFQRLRVC